MKKYILLISKNTVYYHDVKEYYRVLIKILF